MSTNKKPDNSNKNTKKKYSPGIYPFRNGIYESMYSKRLWTMRQYAGYTSAEETNKRYKFLIDKGVKGLSVAFDLPTQTGYDSDHSLSDGEVGRVGVPISSIEDMEVLLKKIPLENISISMTINSTAAILLSFLVGVAHKRNIALNQLSGTVQNDILKEFIARGTQIFPPTPSMKIVTDVIEFCSNEMPRWNSISVSGYHIREAGSDSIQELAFTFSNAIAYVDAAVERGLDVNQFAKRISFFFNSHNNFFEEISKFRAARVIWAKIIKERYGASDSNAMKCRFHTQTAGSSLQAQQIDNNVVRTTLQATAAVLGGTQSLHTNAKDEALALPNERAAELALRTQQIIAHETNIPDVPDPLAGSYYIEELTDTIINGAEKLIKKIDSLGGAIKGIENNFQQEQIGQSAYKYQMEIEKKKKIIVGLNDFNDNEDSLSYDIQKINSKESKKQIDRLKKFKRSRDRKKTKLAIKKFEDYIQSNNNIMPAIIEAVKNNITLGEISKVLRKKFGEYTN